MKIPDEIKALIFDMDGTLVNSESVGPETFAQLCKKYGAGPSKDELDTFIMSWRRIGDYTDEDVFLSNFVKDNNLNIQPQQFIKEFFETYEINLTDAPSLSGADGFLKNAKRKGYLMAIVSASKKIQIETVISDKYWQDIFDFIIGEEDVNKHKPDPEGYLKAIEKIGEPADKCVIFEDSVNGVLAAKAAGAHVVGLKEGNSDSVDLTNADIVLNNFSEIEF